jgi:pentatricopeptide repeat protein
LVGAEPNICTYNALIDGLTEKGAGPNVCTYNALLDGYCLRSQMKEAKNMIDIMVGKGCAPDVHSYSIIDQWILQE